MNLITKRLFGYGLAVLLSFAVSGCTKQDDVFLELCEKGTADEVRRALASGANVHARDAKFGGTALMWAAGNSNPEVVKVLLAGGADVRAVDKWGNDAILYAQHNETGAKEKIICTSPDLI